MEGKCKWRRLIGQGRCYSLTVNMERQVSWLTYKEMKGRKSRTNKQMRNMIKKPN
jgi:hypothetical protein